MMDEQLNVNKTSRQLRSLPKPNSSAPFVGVARVAPPLQRSPLRPLAPVHRIGNLWTYRGLPLQA